ncbi:MAG TPA: GDSL-type esterase/lipase family protein [Nitrospira sp.]|nr:GDSL-type esterase/lipase family protein [Nitrospira sp.]
MIGDSITQGWEDEGQPIWQTFYASRRAANLGFNGDRTEHVVWRLEHGEVEGVAPRLAVVLIGTNDLASGRSVEDTARGIRSVVHALRMKLPCTTILLLAVFPRSASPSDPIRLSIRSVNRLIARYADGEHIFYLDLGDKFTDDQGYLRKDLMPDTIHLNRLGYQVWADSMEQTIEGLLHRQISQPAGSKAAGSICPVD